jgi:hypothetical protein
VDYIGLFYIGENGESSFMLSGQALVFDDATQGSAPKTQPFKTGVFGPLSWGNLLQGDHQPPGLEVQIQNNSIC